MNVGIILVLLAVIFFALKSGMIWIALAAGGGMLLFASESMGDVAEKNVGNKIQGGKQFLRPSKEDYTGKGGTSQQLKIMNWPNWDGDEFWEVGIKHGSSALGKFFGWGK